MTYNMKLKNNFFLWLFGEFSDIKTSNRNSMDDFEIFYCNIFKWKRSDLRWVVGSIPILITPNNYRVYLPPRILKWWIYGWSSIYAFPSFWL